MYGLFYKYLTTVPASTYEKSRTYVSLFDHLKLTSAIASCLAVSNGKERFNMLEFDISGIQKFIFRVTEGGEAKKQIAKSLRGRSLLISMITDCITMSYLHEFGLSESNIIFNTGGGALLLLPDCEDYQERISRITDRLTQALYERFDTDITFVQASVSCDAKELEEFKISKAIDLKARLDEAKSHKYLSVMDENFFFTHSNGKGACELCGKETNGTVRCETCQTILALSDQLVKKEQLVLLFEVGKKTDFRLDEGVQMTLGDCTATLTTRPVVEKKEAAGQLDLNTVAGIESINHAWMGQTRYLAADVPMNKDRNLIPMDKICELVRQDEWGDPKLGILKMDVDNLGAVFAYGLPAGTRSLSKYLTLSRMMEIFFGKYLPDICREISDLINPAISEETSNDTMFYINYAGGDDLVILGPAAGILELASAIRQDFFRYTNNRNLTISGGIFIQKPKQPVRFGVLQAEKYLDQSKELSGKNGITLIGTPLTFEEYGQMLDLVGSWRQAIEDGIYSRTGFYGLMKLLDVTNLPEFSRRIPLALYALKRNAKNQRFVDELKTRICAIADPMEKDQRAAMEKLRRLVLEMKLTIMQTRDGGNDSMQEGRE